MPREGYITKQDLKFDEMRANPMQQEQEQGEEWKAYHKLTTDTKALTQNKRTSYFSSKTKEDSALMKQVKDALDGVTNFYMENTVSADEEEFKKQLSELQQRYAELRRHCERYLEEKKGGLKRIYKGEGYRRYQMVKMAHTKASVELTILESRAKQVFESFRDTEDEAERPLWVNVLAEARTRHLNLQKQETGTISYTGGNTSNVIKLTSPTGEVAYIKKNENNVSSREFIGSYIQNFMESNAAREILESGTTEETLRGFLSFLAKQLGEPGPIQQSFIKSRRIYAEDFQKGKVTPEFFEKALGKAKIPIPQEIQDFFHTAHAAHILGDFGAYIYRHDLSFDVAFEVAKIDVNSSITDRNVATYRMAELLGIQDLIPATQKVVYLDKDGKEQRGILMAEAKGKELWEAGNDVKRSEADFRRESIVYDKAIYLQLNSLQILDIITGQVDRHDANVMVEYQDNRIMKLKGIDNDLCFGKVSYKEIMNPEKPVSQMKPLEEKGVPTLGCIDKKVYDSVLALNDEMITYVFADLLTKGEMKALLNRIHGVQKLFRRIRSKNFKVKIRSAEEMTNYDVMRMKHLQKQCYTDML